MSRPHGKTAETAETAEAQAHAAVPRPGAPRDDSARPGALSARLPLKLSLMIMAVTLLAAALVHTYVRQQQIARTDKQLSIYSAALSDRLTDYENLLLATHSYLQSDNGTVTDLSSFTRGLNVQQYFPSVQQLDVLRSDAGYPPEEFRQVGGVAIPQEARQGIHDTFHLAIRSSSTQVTGPFEVQPGEGSVDKRPYQALFVVMPSGYADSGQFSVVYLLVRTEVLLNEVEQLTPPGDTPTRVLLDRTPLSGGPAPSDPASSDPAAVLSPAASASSLGDWWGRSGGGSTVTQQFDRLGHRWTFSAYSPAFSVGEVATLMAPLLLLLGLVVALTAHRLVSEQVALTRRLGESNTELESSRNFLEQSRADFSAIFQSMENSAVFTTPGGDVRLLNRRFESLFRGAQSSANLHIAELWRRLLPDGTPGSHQLLSGETPETYSHLACRLQTASGELMWGELSRMPVQGPQGDLLGYLHVIRDVTAERQAEAALRRQERQSRSVLDGVPHMLWLSGADGALVYGNAEFRRLLPAPAVRAQVHPGDRAAYDALWERAYRSGEQAELDLRMTVAADPAAGGGSQGAADAGPWRWMSLKLAPLQVDPQEPPEWIAVATDVHDRLMAENQARAEQQHSRQVLNGMPQMVWTTDAGWHVTYVNQRWAEFFPELQHPFELLEMLRWVHPDDRETFEQAVAEARARTGPLETEARLRSPDGSYRHFVARAVPLRGEDGQVTEWVGTHTDVDDQVFAEFSARLMMQVADALGGHGSDAAEVIAQALEDHRYQAALDLLSEQVGAVCGLWRVDLLPPDPAHGDAPPAAGPRLDLQPLARTHPGLWQGDWAAQAERVVAETVVRGEAMMLQEHALLRAIGAAGLMVFPLYGHDGSMRGAQLLAYMPPIGERDFALAEQVARRFALALDNDSLRQRVLSSQSDLQRLNQSLEERVVERTAQLKEANRELEAFSYSVSHDLRTPLRHMTGFGELLRKKLQTEGELSPQAERYLNVILDSGQRMSELIDNLLEFSRMGRAELRQQQVDLSDLVGQVWESLQPDREGRQIAFQLDPLPQVYGDERLLVQVFANLLGNALKYTRPREEVLIRVTADLRAEAGMADIHVSDNGVGFDPRYTDKLFGVFQRLHKNEEFEGTGIGLANVRRIVQRHGGQVTAAGALDSGATFTVTLPLRPPPDPDLPGPALPRSGSTGPGSTGPGSSGPGSTGPGSTGPGPSDSDSPDSGPSAPAGPPSQGEA